MMVGVPRRRRHQSHRHHDHAALENLNTLVVLMLEVQQAASFPLVAGELLIRLR
jgi:hypothetical protein